jgi:hypothetical protein
MSTWGSHLLVRAYRYGGTAAFSLSAHFYVLMRWLTRSADYIHQEWVYPWSVIDMVVGKNHQATGIFLWVQESSTCHRVCA